MGKIDGPRMIFGRIALLVLCLTGLLFVCYQQFSYGSDEKPGGAIMGLPDGNIIVIDFQNWELRKVKLPILNPNPPHSYSEIHYFPGVAKAVFIGCCKDERDGGEVVLEIDLKEGITKYLEIPKKITYQSIYIHSTLYSTTKPNIMYICYSKYDSLEYDLLKQRIGPKVEQYYHVFKYDLEMENWTDVTWNKKQAENDGFVFSDGLQIREFNFEKFQKLDLQEKKKNINDMSYEGELYKELIGVLYDQGVLKKEKLESGAHPILHWDEHFLLCRSEGKLVVVELEGDGKPRIIADSPAELSKQNPLLLKPSTVELIYDNKVVKNFNPKVEQKTALQPVPSVSIPYPEMSLLLPRSYEDQIDIEVETGAATTVKNLRLVWDASDQEDSVWPVGVNVLPLKGIPSVGPNQKVKLTFKIWGDDSAPEKGTVWIRVVSDEKVWGAIQIDYYYHKN